MIIDYSAVISDFNYNLLKRCALFHCRNDSYEQEMLVAELVYSFLIPEVHKQDFRQKGIHCCTFAQMGWTELDVEYIYAYLRMFLL